jgi:hypothetical protein
VGMALPSMCKTLGSILAHPQKDVSMCYLKLNVCQDLLNNGKSWDGLPWWEEGAAHPPRLPGLVVGIFHPLWLSGLVCNV